VSNCVEAEDLRACKYCRQSLAGSAVVCYHCGRSQDWWNLQAVEFTNLLGLVLTFGLLILSSCQFHEAKKDRLEAADAERQATAALDRAKKTEKVLQNQLNIQAKQTAEINATFATFFGDLCSSALRGIFNPNTQVCQLSDGRLIKYRPAIPSAARTAQEVGSTGQ